MGKIKISKKQIIASVVLATIALQSLALFGTQKSDALSLEMPERRRPASVEEAFSKDFISGTITGGQMHSIMITGVGTVKTVGDNQYGQLGNGKTGSGQRETSWQNVLGLDGVGLLDDVIQVKGTSSQGSSYALKLDGSVWSWGQNNYGQLGHGNTLAIKTPAKINNLSDIVEISAGGYHSLALKTDGTVWAWGNNSLGELGDGTTTYKSIPVKISSLTDIVKISAGANHSLALKSDGTVWSWGRNDYGQLGDGTKTQRTTPVQVKGENVSPENLTGVVDIVAGSVYSLFLKSDGTVWAWGNPYYGTGISIPAEKMFNQIEIQDVVKIYSDNVNSLFIKSDGTVWAMGQNQNSYLGTGALQKPTIINSLNDTVTIGIGGGNSAQIAYFAIKSNGDILTWGSNGAGQSGNGTMTAIKTPTKITVEGQATMNVIPDYRLYKFNTPKEGNYEGNKEMDIQWELISDEVTSFDIYYAHSRQKDAPGADLNDTRVWTDESTWVEVAKAVPVSSLTVEQVDSDLLDDDGTPLKANRYTYKWNAPNQHLNGIRFIMIPNY